MNYRSPEADANWQIPPVNMLPLAIAEPFILTPDDVERLHAADWSGVGIIFHIMDSAGKLLIAEHRATAKHPKIGWGPNSETLKVSETSVEHPLHAATRCFWEELEIDDPNSLQLRTGGPLVLSRITRPGQTILAVTLPLIVPDSSRNRLVMKLSNNPEILRTRFSSVETLRSMDNVRDGTHQWLQDVKLLGHVGLGHSDCTVEFPSLSAGDLLHDTDHWQAVAALNSGLPS